VDLEDTTLFSVGGTTPQVVLQYDYNSIYTFKLVYMKIVTQSYTNFVIQISSDNNNWTTLATIGSDTTYYYTGYNLTFRYLRFLLNCTVSNGAGKATVNKIILIR
jgi:hypothetical protein